MPQPQDTQHIHPFYTRVKNMTNVIFNKDETDLLEKGLNYALEKPVKQFLQDLIIDTDNAIVQLDDNDQNTYRFLASKKITQLLQSNRHNILHKRQSYIMKQIDTKLKQTNLIITKADKGNTIVIIHRDEYIHKVETFLEDNQFTQLHKDPIDHYQKKIQQATNRSNMIISKLQKKHLTQIKPLPPTLKAQIKIHKDNEPIRPVINNVFAPSYKIAKFLNKWLTDTLQLSHTYTTHSSTNLAHQLDRFPIIESDRLISFDIKDIYVNIPLEETINITKNLLKDKNINTTTTNQACTLLTTILQQNYLQFNNKFYQPSKGVGMGSPISGLIAEIFLQHGENNLIKNILDNNKIRFYNRYVDDILMIYDSTKTNTTYITQYMNNIHNALQFKATTEVDNTISFLDLSISRQQNKLTFDIYRKPTTTGMTIHQASNHPTEHKMAAYRYLLNRMHRMPLSQELKHKELNTIYLIASRNGYSKHLVDKLNKNITAKTENQTDNTAPPTSKDKKWAVFGYHSPIIRKITNLFKDTNLNIAFNTVNTTQKLLRTHTQNHDPYSHSGIYSLACNTCHKQYIGQTGRTIKQRYTEHIRYIKNNDPKSAYALHILNHRHEWGPIDKTMNLLHTCKKSKKMNTLEHFYIHKSHGEGILIPEQHAGEKNRLFTLITQNKPKEPEHKGNNSPTTNLPTKG